MKLSKININPKSLAFVTLTNVLHLAIIVVLNAILRTTKDLN